MTVSDRWTDSDTVALEALTTPRLCVYCEDCGAPLGPVPYDSTDLLWLCDVCEEIEGHRLWLEANQGRSCRREFAVDTLWLVAAVAVGWVIVTLLAR